MAMRFGWECLDVQAYQNRGGGTCAPTLMRLYILTSAFKADDDVACGHVHYADVRQGVEAEGYTVIACKVHTAWVNLLCVASDVVGVAGEIVSCLCWRQGAVGQRGR